MIPRPVCLRGEEGKHGRKGVGRRFVGRLLHLKEEVSERADTGTSYLDKHLTSHDKPRYRTSSFDRRRKAVVMVSSSMACGLVCSLALWLCDTECSDLLEMERCTLGVISTTLSGEFRICS